MNLHPTYSNCSPAEGLRHTDMPWRNLGTITIGESFVDGMSLKRGSFGGEQYAKEDSR